MLGVCGTLTSCPSGPTRGVTMRVEFVRDALRLNEGHWQDPESEWATEHMRHARSIALVSGREAPSDLPGELIKTGVVLEVPDGEARELIASQLAKRVIVVKRLEAVVLKGNGDNRYVRNADDDDVHIPLSSCRFAPGTKLIVGYHVSEPVARLLLEGDHAEPADGKAPQLRAVMAIDFAVGGRFWRAGDELKVGLNGDVHPFELAGLKANGILAAVEGVELDLAISGSVAVHRARA